MVRISLCEHNWVEIAKGQFKRKQYDNYDRCIGSNCIGDTITLKCKKCGEIKTIGVDIIR